MKITKTEQTEPPFVIIYDEESNKWRIAMGRTIATRDEFDTAEEADNYIKSKPWEMIVTICAIMYEHLTNENIKNL